MNAIAAVSLDWGIGRDNQLLFHIKEDMKRFRSLTSGGMVLMGRKTLDSMPGGKPLPNRRNIVITRQADFSRPGVETAASPEEAVRMAAGWDPETVWVIGGGEIYRALLPYCSRCFLTQVYDRPACDSFFPNLDSLSNWQPFRWDALQVEGGLAYQFIEYLNQHPERL